MRLDDRPEPMMGVANDAARARERMGELERGGSREMSPRARRLIAWAVVVVIIGFFVASFAGWIDILPA